MLTKGKDAPNEIHSKNIADIILESVLGLSVFQIAFFFIINEVLYLGIMMCIVVNEVN